MSRTYRNRPHWGDSEWLSELCRTGDHRSCWCCSQKRQRFGKPRMKRMKPSDRRRVAVGD